MKISNLFKGDKVIWMVFLFLFSISIIEVFSASSTLTYKSQNYMGPLVNHATMFLVGLVVAIVTLNIPCRYFKIATPFLIALTWGTLLWVLVGGESINGANRVISLGGFTFQPSEIAKGTMVLVTAQILSAMQKEDGSGVYEKAMRYVLVIVVPTVLLIGRENLSTAALLFSVVVVMMFIGRVPLLQLGKLMGVVLIVAAAFLTFIMTAGSIEQSQETESSTGIPVAQVSNDKKSESLFSGILHRAATWRNRILNHSKNEGVPAEDYDLDNNYQVGHANIAIASANLIGRGPGNSVERDFLPQAFSDFIYAIIIEESGLAGAIIVVFLYVVLLFRTARIASRCENNFPALLVMGLGLMLVIQAVINMLVAVGIFPVTGQPLPLISKGGTSTIINCAYIGAILSVSRSAKKVGDDNVKLQPITA